MSINHASKHTFLFAIVLGVALSILLGWILYAKETNAIEHHFKNDVHDKAAALERELSLNMEALYSVKSTFDSSEQVTASEFARITQNIFTRHSDIQALEWVPKVPNSQRSSFEKTIRQQYPDFEITQIKTPGSMMRAQQRQNYFPVHYVEPMTGNELAFGFDYASNPKYQQTLEMSRDQGIPLASSSTALARDSGDQKSFAIFMPAYKGQPTTIEKRRINLRGFVVAVFRIEDIFTSAIKRTTAKGINLKLIDKSDPDSGILINTQSSQPTSSSASGLQFTSELPSVAGRQWAIIATPTSGYIAERRTILPYVISLFGILLTAIGAAYSFVVLRRASLIEQTVQDRTKDLLATKKELEALTKIDSLTGIANRRHFTEYLETEWHRAIRDKSPLSLIMIDIDHFKAFNDMYGHLDGDECLIKVARSLQATCHRSTDLITRTGGEEFIAILPNTENPVSLAEQCREAIENLQVPAANNDTSSFVTVSVGVATVIPDENASITELTRDADRALYKAKESGRNRVSCDTESH